MDAYVKFLGHKYTSQAGKWMEEHNIWIRPMMDENNTRESPKRQTDTYKPHKLCNSGSWSCWKGQEGQGLRGNGPKARHDD